MGELQREGQFLEFISKKQWRAEPSCIIKTVKNIREILRYTSGLRNLFVFITIASVITALLGLVTPFLIRDATNLMVNIVAHKQTFDLTPIVLLAGGVLVVNLISYGLGDIAGYYGDIMAVRVRQQLSKRYYEHLMTLPQHYYDSEVTGKIINRLSRAISEITQFLNFFANNLLEMLLTVIISLGIMAYYSPILAILMLLLIPVHMFLSRRSSTTWQELEHEKNSHFDVASGRFAEVVGQMRLVKSFGTEKSELRFFDERINDMVRLTRKQSRHWHIRNSQRGMLQSIIYGGIFLVLFYQTATGGLTIGDMVLLITLVNQVNFPLQRMNFFIEMYQRAAANSKDYIEALQEESEPEEEGARALVVTDGRVEYREVSFAYGGEKNVLHGIDFEISPGKKLALVGESGGGKTTISNLLMGLYQPVEGMIFIDGQNIAEVTKASLRRQIATVFQDPALFSGTIRENIAYAKPDASDAEIKKAAKAANALEFIEGLSDTFDTEIGERGIKLSGGQKQRIAIARAILKDAPILILDEATSSLDSKAEHEVQMALDHLMKNRTVLIIAHRLSTIASVDTIVTLKKGRVDEIGSPKELAKTDGIYHQLLALQLGSNEAAKEQLAQFEITS